VTEGRQPSVVRIDGVIRRYAWGSTTAIQELLGQPVDGEPAAELWIGAHPDDPAAVVEQGMTLDALIASDPTTWLGSPVVDRFGPRLPFLLKVLAAEKPLSIQVHPTIEQAQEGFARENADGVAANAPERNYRDANHKPELLCALTPFEALCGFRPIAETLALFDALDLPGLIPVGELLSGPGGLRAAFTALLRDAAPAGLAEAVADAARALPEQWVGAARAVALAAAQFPDDVGVVLSLLLNYVELQPGEAIYLGAGNVHAYLCGTGIEIMANSDNVLRCGLTPKHIDVDELLRITDFSELVDPRWQPQAGGVAAEDFAVPVADFALSRMDVDGFKGSLAVGATGPHIVLCVSGGQTVSVGADAVVLTPGQAAFVRARPEWFGIRGTGVAFAATIGELS
jgi:mannose-6-phosphate isomerase